MIALAEPLGDLDQRGRRGLLRRPGTVSWPDAIVLTAGTVVGSCSAPRASRQLRPSIVHGIVVAVGVAMTAAFLFRR